MDEATIERLAERINEMYLNNEISKSNCLELLEMLSYEYIETE